MKDKEVRAQVEERVRERFRPFFEQKRQENALSDEEWWERKSKAFKASMQSEEVKALFLRRRAALDLDELLESMVRQKTDKLMPVILAMNVEGPITDEVYRRATMTATSDEIATLSAKLNAAAERQTDPRKREVLERFTQKVALDRQDLDSLDSTDLSEELLWKVASSVSARQADLVELLRRRPNEDQQVPP